MAHTAGYKPADAIREDARQNVLRGTGQIRAVGARIQNGWRVPYVATKGELIVHRIGGLGVNLVEAQVGLDNIEARRIKKLRRTSDNCGIEALATRIVIVPGAEIEGELAEGGSDAAIKVDLRCGALRER